MQSTSAEHKRLWADNSFLHESDRIDFTAYSTDSRGRTFFIYPNRIKNLNVQRSIYGMNGSMVIGRALSATATAQFVLPDNEDSQFLAEHGLKTAKNISADEAAYVGAASKINTLFLLDDYTDLGTFYLSEYDYDKSTGFWNATAADLIGFLNYKLSVIYYLVSGNTTTDIALLEKIASAINTVYGDALTTYSVDSRTYDYMDQGFNVPMTWETVQDSDITVREALGYIAALYGANIVLTPQNTLLLVPFWKGQNDGNFTAIFDDSTSDNMKAVNGYTVNNPIAYTGVTITTDDGTEYSAGTTGNVLSFDCPWGTQQVADFLYNKINGKQFLSYTADHVRIDPACEPGDYVVLDNVPYLIGYQNIDLRPGTTMGLGVPTYPETTVSNDYAPRRRQSQRQTARQTIKEEIGGGFIKKYETQATIKNAYIINQSTWEPIYSAGTWEADTLYLPIQGL